MSASTETELVDHLANLADQYYVYLDREWDESDPNYAPDPEPVINNTCDYDPM